MFQRAFGGVSGRFQRRFRRFMRVSGGPRCFKNDTWGLKRYQEDFGGISDSFKRFSAGFRDVT